MVRPGRGRHSGMVEVDETFVGGEAVGGKRGRGAGRKSLVVIAVEVFEPKGFGRVRMKCVADASGASLIPFISDAVVSRIISPAIVQDILWRIWPVFPHWMHRWDSVGTRSNLGRVHQSMGGGVAEAMRGRRRCSSGIEEERAAGGCPPRLVQKFSGSSKSNRSGCALSSWSRSPRSCSMRTNS